MDFQIFIAIALISGVVYYVVKKRKDGKSGSGSNVTPREDTSNNKHRK